jgi:NADH dehydrogenase (ubiquinone) 1 alpha subcomplex subunit 6
MWTSARHLTRATTTQGRIVADQLSRAFTVSALTETRVGPSDILSTPRPSLDTPSSTIDEALTRGRQLYRDACREIPWVLSNYALEEVTTSRDIRRTLKAMIREKGEDIMRTLPSDEWPGAVDQAVMRGREELVALEAHHYQRHHLIATFVNARCVDAASEGTKGATKSAFVKSFLSDGRREMH